MPVGIDLTLAFTFSDLHVAQYQKASAEVAVIRNARLLGPSGPLTNDAFIFMTEPASFADSVVPLLSWDAFDIGIWKADGSPLATVMSGLLNSEVSGTLSVSFGIHYGYELVPGAELRTRLPVAFRPLTPYQSTDAGRVAGVIEAWRGNQNPSAVNGEWVFSTTLFSNLPEFADKPLLEISQLHSALQT